MSTTIQSQNEHAKVDRRIQRTRKALRESLLDLIQEKGYESITVEEIVQRANLGRATFYLHYKEKEDLLLEEFNEVAKDEVQILSEFPFFAWMGITRPGDERWQGKSPLGIIFQHAADNAEIYRLVLGGSNSQRIIEKLQGMIAHAVEEVVQSNILANSKEKLQVEVPLDLLVSCFSGALFSSLIWWLDQPNPPPAEEMGLMFQHMIFPGIARVLGLLNPKMLEFMNAAGK
jgi:AcrR family transcriptional regulator